jgi:HNH endonuclease
MLHPPAESDKDRTSDAIPEIWDLLFLFWDEDRVMKWRNTIFSDAENPSVSVEGCFNLISLSPNAHEMWNRGLFALKPLKLSRDRKKLTVQFFWQTPGNYKINDRIDLLTEPTSSEGRDFVGDGNFLSRFENDVSSPRIRSGDTSCLRIRVLNKPRRDKLKRDWSS